MKALRRFFAYRFEKIGDWIMRAVFKEDISFISLISFILIIFLVTLTFVFFVQSVPTLIIFN